MTENVFLFPKAHDDAVTPDAVVKRKDWQGCQHKVQLVLDHEAHQLRCPACSQVLDPYDWIESYIAHWESTNTRFRQAKQQALEAEKRLLDLKRVEKNAKARARKAGVLLTSPQARSILDAFNGLERVLYLCVRNESTVPREVLTEEVLRRWFGECGIDKEKFGEVRRYLHDSIELIDREPPAADVAGSAPAA